MTTLDIILGSTTAGSVILFLLTWLREKKKDKAGVDKTHAETESELASAQEKRANAETKIADAALEWAEKLNVELDKTRLTCDRQKGEIDQAWNKLRESQLEIDRLKQQLVFMDQSSKIEREHCEKMTQELFELKKKLNQIKDK